MLKEFTLSDVVDLVGDGSWLDEARTQTDVIAPTNPQAYFIKGPIPVDWIRAACTRDMATIRVAHALWWLAGINGDRKFALNSAARNQFDLSSQIVYRGLRALEEEGLVRVVERKRGSHTIVEILDAPKPVNLFGEERATDAAMASAVIANN